MASHTCAKTDLDGSRALLPGLNVPQPITTPVTQPTIPTLPAAPTMTAASSSILQARASLLRSSAPPLLRSSAPPLLRSSAPPLLRSSAPPLLRSSAPPLLRSSAPPLLRSSAPPLLRSSAPPLIPSSIPPSFRKFLRNFPAVLRTYSALDFVLAAFPLMKPHGNFRKFLRKLLALVWKVLPEFPVLLWKSFRLSWTFSGHHLKLRAHTQHSTCVITADITLWRVKRVPHKQLMSCKREFKLSGSHSKEEEPEREDTDAGDQEDT
ncbi:uncharacterized protein HD556DRAFT_1471536 [Suillus plorans]|uniref:Uncharacterized protein n=1 Tax=Suillus plorans TaxID=116603 RepID=A0A9P7DJ95_9AGAM|nr:uncharacterized protein HD556DRAFT_1471536 [Suillus plorans]KAG1796041.1 hypothetical protein HD556DRAFT_1471536 [Suillus plorans]